MRIYFSKILLDNFNCMSEGLPRRRQSDPSARIVTRALDELSPRNKNSYKISFKDQITYSS